MAGPMPSPMSVGSGGLGVGSGGPIGGVGSPALAPSPSSHHPNQQQHQQQQHLQQHPRFYSYTLTSIVVLITTMYLIDWKILGQLGWRRVHRHP